MELGLNEIQVRTLINIFEKVLRVLNRKINFISNEISSG